MDETIFQILHMYILLSPFLDALRFNSFSRALDKREYLMIFLTYPDHMLFFLFLIKIICRDPSSEPSHRDGSDDGS